ncbi:MAG: hypothetical protein KME37_09745 [Candidatus Thiodiazotropha sp. (ex Codakia orbicularis)]|nr:hypothetical protein [Candidatus Thiodiazotropha sp. (ex Codakia orbicularis)]
MDYKKYKKHVSRGPYHYLSGTYYKDEKYEGVPVIGRWIREDFIPKRLLWWTPRHSITSSYIAQLKDGRFAVRRMGMNDGWYGCNSEDHVLEDFEDASQLLEKKVEIANKQSLSRHIGIIVTEILIALVAIAILSIGIWHT